MIGKGIKSRPGLNKPDIVVQIGKSKATVERAISALITARKVEHRGSKKTGGCYAVETERKEIASQAAAPAPAQNLV